MRFRIVLIGLQNIRIFGVMLRRKLAAAANLNTILKYWCPVKIDSNHISC